MSLPTNPYIAGAPLRGEKGFFGRQDTLEWVERELRNSQTNALVLFGQRRIGKTTLLLQLARNLSRDEFIPIYFDLQDQATRPLGKTLIDIAEILCERANLDLGELGPFDDHGRYFQKDFLPKFYAALGEKHRPVFLLDEFDVLDQTAEAELAETATAKALFPLLRRLITTDDRSAFVFVVGRRAEDLSIDFSATFKASLVREIWVLDDKSAEALVRQAQTNGTLKFTDDAIQRILSLTNHHPYLTQLLCQRVWELAYASGLASPVKIDSTQVETALESSLEAGNQALDWLWNGLNPAEKIYASALAEIAGENETIPEERIIEVLAAHAARLRTREVELAPRDLVKRHVLDISGERGYRFAVELFRRWVHKNKPLLVVKDEVDRIDPMADRFFVFGDGFYDTRQWEKAAFYFREALNVNPRHFRARLYLGETLLEQGKVDDAIAELDQALILDREEARLPLARAWLAKAEMLKPDGDSNAVLEAYEKALELSPRESLAIQGRAVIWIQRAQQAEGRGDLLGAREAYIQAGDQNNVDRLNKLEREQILNKLQLDAQEHIKDEHWESAVATYTQMVELALDDATRQVWQLELEKAQMQAAEQSVQAKAQAIEKMKMQAREHEQREEWEKAIQIYEDLNQMGGLDTWNVLLENAKHQQEIVTTFERGRQALAQEDWKDAQQLFAKIIQVQPDYSYDGLLAAVLLQDAIRHRKGIFYNLMRWPWASNYRKALKYLQDTSKLRTGDTPSIDVEKTPILQSTSLHEQAFTQETQVKELWAEIIHITRAWISVIFKPSVKSFEVLIDDPRASTKRAFIQVLIAILVISLITATSFGILGLTLIPLGLVVFFLFTGMTHWISQRGLGGEGSYSSLAYAYAPPTFLLFLVLGISDGFLVLSIFISAPLWIYSAILAVIANRAIYKFSLGKAIAAYVLSIIVFVVLIAAGIGIVNYFVSYTFGALVATEPAFTEAPAATEAAATEIPATESPATEMPATESPATEMPAEVIDSNGMPMVLVPAGEFTMGSDSGDDDEKPVHQVYLDDFYIDQYEVTNALYQACVDDGVCEPPRDTSSSTNSSYFGNSEFDNYPVINVDWFQAQAYCEWRGAQLPTEAQWEKAARGEDGRTYPWGEEIDCSIANHLGCEVDTTEVGSYEGGTSPSGLYDMAGNVREWVADWYSETYYQNSSASNPLGSDSGEIRVLRSGSWDVEPYHVRAAYRHAYAPEEYYADTGFRCSRSP